MLNRDIETKTLTIVLHDADVAVSDDRNPGVILDYDATGRLVSVEILEATLDAQDLEISRDAAWAEPTIEELAEQQGVKPFAAEQVSAGTDLWATDDEFEAFLADLDARRQEARRHEATR